MAVSRHFVGFCFDFAPHAGLLLGLNRFLSSVQKADPVAFQMYQSTLCCFATTAEYNTRGLETLLTRSNRVRMQLVVAECA
jgi:hypothetical protein